MLASNVKNSNDRLWKIGFDDPGTKEMLGVFDRFQTLHNNSEQNATTCNRLCKRTQHVKSNNVGSFWPAMLCPFARGLRCRSCLLALKRMTLQALQKVSRQTHPESLTRLCLFICLFVYRRSWISTVQPC